MSSLFLVELLAEYLIFARLPILRSTDRRNVNMEVTDESRTIEIPGQDHVQMMHCRFSVAGSLILTTGLQEQGLMTR